MEPGLADYVDQATITFANQQEECVMATARQKNEVEQVMHEHKEGTLKSGSGKKVKSRKQAIAIRDVRKKASRA